MDRGGGRGGRERGYPPRGGGGRGGQQSSGRGQPPRGGGHPSGAGGRDGNQSDYQSNRGSRGGFQEGQSRRSDANQSCTDHGYQQGGHRSRGFAPRTQTQIRYSSDPLSLDSKHVAGPLGFKCPGQEFPAPGDLPRLKALIPKKISPGTLSHQKVHLKINFFLAQITLPKELFRYEVKITKEMGKKVNKKMKQKEEEGDQQPRPPKKDLRVKIFKWFINRIHESWAAVNPKERLPLMHDFSEIMVTTKPLESVVDLEYDVHHRELENEDDSDISYHIKISNTGLNLDIPRLQRMLNDLKNVNAHFGGNETSLQTIEQFYNILIKNIGGSTYLPLGRNSLMKIPENEMDAKLGSGLCNWQGITATYTMSTSWKPYINIEIQNSAFRIGQPVDDAVADVLKGSRTRNLRFNDVTTWRSDDFNAVLDLLKSCKVTRKVAGNRMDGVVRGVLQDPPSKCRFTCEELNNEEVTIPEYFWRRYNLKINPKGMLLQIGAKAKVPSELCSIIKGQSYNRMLTNEVVTNNMLKIATQKPGVKERNIKEAIEDLKMTKNKLLEDFGVNFSDQMLDLEATRVLSPPELCYGIKSGGQPQQTGVPSRGRIIPQNGEWDQWGHNVQFFKPMSIDFWAVLILDDNRSDAERFISALRDNGQRIGGMTIPQPSEVIGRRDIEEFGNPAENIAEIVKVFEKLKRRWPENKKSFVLVVIPKKGGSLYNQVKQAAELHVNAGILTQCVIKKNFDNANHSVVKNILLKINCKLGGINHVPVIPKHLNSIDILKTPVMIVGIDVNHPSPGGRIPQPSFAAVTASIDRSGMPYMMHIQAQMKAERGAAEVVQNLEQIMFDMIRGFYTHIKKNTGQMVKPSKIIVYRDGVGTGQFPEVLDIELRAIRKACEKFKDDDGNPYRPKITIIAVQKRHKVRFFLKNSDENAPPGTVVDTEIVTSDFYLLSHKGMLGTSRPTHYQVLWDDSDFSSDDIQALSYYLCYMYSRCNKSVSYPAPTYYAHWAAKRATALCKIGGQLPAWWDGTVGTLGILNDALQRKENVTAGFPMHFV